MENHTPWYRTARRWGQTNLTEDDPKRLDLDFWKAYWKRCRIQGVIVNAGGIVAYYPSRFTLQYRAFALEGADYFGLWNQAAREAGLAVIARMDSNRADVNFYNAHRDWFCLHRDGSPVMSQGRYFSCVNGGYYAEYIPGVLREIIGRYHPDGFADNSWKGMDRDTICYCENCGAKFRRDTGFDLPPAVNWDDPVYRAWIRWGYQNRADNWDLFNKATREAGGADCLWLGMLHADPANVSGGFADLKTLCARSPIIFNDQQGRETAGGFERNSVSGNLLRLAAEESVAAPESTANYVRGPRAFRLASNPPYETRMWAVDGIAGGISPWYHFIGGGRYDSRQFENLAGLFDWHAANEAYLYDRENAADVGIIWSQENADFYGRGNARETVSLPWFGVCRAMTQSRVPFLPVHASDIRRYGKRLKVLILPDVAILTEEQEDGVCAFIRNGGGIVLSGLTGLFDRDGNRKAGSKLLETLGITLTGESKGITGAAGESWEDYASHSYMRLPAERHEILRGFENTGILPFGGVLRVAESRTLTPVCSYIPPFPIYPPEFSWIRGECPDVGVIFAGETGFGGRAAYLAGDIDRCYGRALLPDHAKLLGNAVRWTAGGDPPLTVEGPGYLDCCLYRQPGRAILHIVNLSGANQSPGYCGEIYPVGPLRISARVSGRPEHVYLRVSGGEAPFRLAGGRAEFTLERLGDHEMAVIT